MLKYVLLGALSYRQPLTGYQVKRFIDQSAKHFWYAQTSQVYRTLDALEKDGLIVSTIEARYDAPDRRVYTITDAGHADLLAWLTQPMTEIEPTKDALLVRLFFAAQIDKDTILTQLRLQRALHQQQLTLLTTDIVAQIRESVTLNPHMQRDGLMWDITRRMGELSEEAYIRWLDETIARIENEF